LSNQLENWKNGEIIDYPMSIIYDQIDNSTIAGYYDLDSRLKEIGFGYPAQFADLLALKDPSLPFDVQKWLMDPSTFGKQIEWIMGACMAESHFSYYVLCLNNQPSNDVYADHADIMLNDWQPCQQHAGIPMRVFPDQCGTGNTYTNISYW
jgi:hypothetical protein